MSERPFWLEIPRMLAGAASIALPMAALGWSTSPMQANPLDRNDVGALYQSFYMAANAVAPGWVGDGATCTPGDTSAEFKQVQIGQINWNRAMAGAPANVQFDAQNLAGAQQLGLMIAVNRMLSHTPPMSWLCFTAAGAEAAGASNIGMALATGPAGPLAAPGLVSGYMRDAGVGNEPVGHRRWVLHPPTEQMTVGLAQFRGTDNRLGTGHNIRVIYGNWNSPWPPTRWGYIAWPPPGFVPWQEAHGRWSFSKAGADFSGATVKVFHGATEVPITVVSKGGPVYGSPAIVWEFTGTAGASFNPLAPTANWAFMRPTSDTPYTVRIENVNVTGEGLRTYEYAVTVFDPTTHEADYNQVFENGWYWNPAENGRGFFVEKQGNLVFVAAYLYADDGRPRWLAALCIMDGAATCGGDLTEYNGGQTLGGAYKSPTSQVIGPMRLTFGTRTTATLQWPGGTVQLERLVFGGNRFDGTTTGWWWISTEPGSGWGFEIQGTTFVLAGYLYDPDGKPVWYLAAGAVTGGNVLAGRLQRYSGGQTLTGPYKPPSPTVADAGAFSLQLTAAEAAAFLAGGRSATLARFIFGR